MRNTLHILLIIFSLCAIHSCGDFLDNPPKGVTIPQKYEDYQKLMNAGKLMGALRDEVFYMSDDIKLLDKEVSATDYTFAKKREGYRNIYSFKPGQIMVSGDDDYLWNTSYGRIFILNTVINDVLDSEGNSQQKKELLWAEALFGRAYYYFDLVNIYAVHYNAATAKTDYGVPYIVKGSIHENVVRHTVQEVYDNILKDLKAAEPHLTNLVPDKSHPSITALNSFYARIYLFMGNYAKALEYANKALAGNPQLLDYNDYEIKEGVTSGRVYLKKDPTQRIPDIDHPETNYAKFCDGYPQKCFVLSDDLRAVFKKHITYSGSTTVDLRKYLFTAEDKINLGSTAYFPGECAHAQYGKVNVAFGSVENLLIAAECEARIGSKEKAMEHINKLRDKRFKNNFHLTATSNDQALEIALDERRREFVLIGAFRLFDLKRLNREERFAKTVTHSADGQTWTLKPNSLLYVFPINQAVLEFMPDMPVYDRSGKNE